MSVIFTVRGAFILVTLSLLFSGFLTSALILLVDPAGQAFLPSTLIVGELLLVVPLIIILTRSKVNLGETLRINPVSKRTLLLSALISCGIVVWADELERIIALIIPPPQWLDQLGQFLAVDNPLSLTLIFIGAVPLAAFSEEVLFRGFLQQVLEKQWQDVTRAVLVGSLFFAVIHLIPYWAVQIYLLGLVMGYLAWITNSIFPSMVLHGINNGIAFSFANWGDFFEGWYDWNGHVSPLILAIGTTMTIFGFRQLNRGLTPVGDS
jgi:membrane protease YdiL (CAAX protease family)